MFICQYSCRCCAKILLFWYFNCCEHDISSEIRQITQKVAFIHTKARSTPQISVIIFLIDYCCRRVSFNVCLSGTECVRSRCWFLGWAQYLQACAVRIDKKENDNWASVLELVVLYGTSGSCRSATCGCAHYWLYRSDVQDVGWLLGRRRRDATSTVAGGRAGATERSTEPPDACFIAVPPARSRPVIQGCYLCYMTDDRHGKNHWTVQLHPYVSAQSSFIVTVSALSNSRGRISQSLFPLVASVLGSGIIRFFVHNKQEAHLP